MAIPALSAKTSIKASLDSSQIVMGNVTAVHLDIVDSEASPSKLVVDENLFPPQVERVDWADGDTTSLGNGLVEIKRSLIIQSFDSGVYTLPPFCLVSGNDTVKSNQLTLKVQPVDVSQMKDINPIAPTLDFTRKWYDFLPDWLTDYWMWILGAALLIAAVVFVILIATHKVNVNILPQKRMIPPYDLAIKRLQALKAKGLCEDGREREYYTLLIDILRDYLQGRFGINAMEMTSTQIVNALSSNDETRDSNRHMQAILEVADFVKYARMRPIPDDNVRSFNNALEFVEETKPVPVDDKTDPSKPGQSGAVPKSGKPQATINLKKGGSK